MSNVMRVHLSFVASLLFLFVAQAETKLTPLKTGGGRPLESLKAKKEPKPASTSEASKKDVAPPEPVFTGPKSGWGIVHVACPFYGNDGQNLGKLAAGTLLTYSAVKHSTKTFVLVSKIQVSATKWDGPFLVEAPDVVMFSGELEKMSPKMINDLKAYYALKGKIEQRKEAIEESAQSRNPHFATAKLWQQRYADSVEKAADMEVKANDLKGPAKSKMLDELRSLKYEQARLKTQADKEAVNYKAWKDKNPISPSLFTTDDELKALNAQLKEAKEKIKDIVVDE
jgi:hypothetical protein